MIPRAVRDDDERNPALERDRGHRSEGSVAARDAQRIGLGGPRDRRRIVPRTEDVGLDAPFCGGSQEVVDRPGTRSRAWIDDQEAAHLPKRVGPERRANEPIGP